MLKPEYRSARRVAPESSRSDALPEQGLSEPSTLFRRNAQWGVPRRVDKALAHGKRACFRHDLERPPTTRLGDKRPNPHLQVGRYTSRWITSGLPVTVDNRLIDDATRLRAVFNLMEKQSLDSRPHGPECPTA